MAPRIKERTDKQASRPAAGFPEFFPVHIVYPQVSVLLCAVCNLRDKCSSFSLPAASKFSVSKHVRVSLVRVGEFTAGACACQ
jgi:hypothetical protein